MTSSPSPDAPAQQELFGVYVHWPFCLAKCPYCDFNSHVRHHGVDQERYTRAFAREIAHQAGLAPGRNVTSIFLGGGTPSLMAPRTVETILETIASHWSIDANVEITLEANPTSVEAERFRGYRAAGVNRLSLGVQALNDSDLKRLGRMHSAAEALDALKIARETFDRVTFDLIYGRPEQSIAQWQAELAQALSFGTEHLSLYQLTIEPDTPFEALYLKGLLKIPDPDLARALYETTQDMSEAAGLPAYEISNHARRGAESRHNLAYWRYAEYAGVGPGAHARLLMDGQRFVFMGEKNPENWLALVENDGNGTADIENLSREEQADEYLLMGLRLREGIDTTTYQSLGGRPMDRARIASLLSEGMIEQTGKDRLRATRDGWLVLDALVADLAS